MLTTSLFSQWNGMNISENTQTWLQNCFYIRKSFLSVGECYGHMACCWCRECEIRRTVGPKGVFFVGVRQTSIHHRSLWPANRAAVSDQSVPPFQWFYLLNLHQNAVRQILPKTSPKNGPKSCWVHVRCNFHLTERVDWSKSKHGRVLNHNLKFVRHFW